MLTSLITTITAIVVGKLVDHYVPSLGSLPLLKTRREVRRMMASGHHLDYAGQWRYGVGMQAVGMVARKATPAELRYCGRENPLPVDAHRELTGGL